MANLFGGRLSITDEFSTIFGKFNNSLKNTNDNFKQITNATANFENETNKSMTNVKSQVMSLAQEYKKMGMSQSEAMKKAWSEVERNSKSSSDNAIKKFDSSLKNTNSSFKQFINNINISEKANRLATQKMKSQIESLAQDYIKQGFTMSQAMKQAQSEIKREAPDTGNRWINAFGRIKQVGVDSFGSIQQKMSNFSNSTLGTISKLTAGFLSLKTVTEGLHTGFETGQEYQNLRVMMNSLYGDEKLAEQKFIMGSNYAQKTMFSENDVIKALSTMKGVGISDDEQTLTMMGDLGSFVSARTNGAMGINEAVEAYADMIQNGEWERMQTLLNIKRTNLESYGQEKGFKAFTNKQGQVTDRETLEKVFKSYLDEKGITGLTEVMGKTATGQLQQTIGNLKKSLADLVGVTNTGEIKDGSLFQKFIQGLQTLNTKIISFSSSGEFDKLSDKLSEIGGAIYSAFNFLIENPELITSLLKFSLAMWGIGKIGSIAGAVNNITGIFKTLLPLLTPLISALAPLAPYIAALVGTFVIAKSVFSPNGVLNKGISLLLGKIPLVGTFLQEGFDKWTNMVSEFFTNIIDWFKSKLGFGKSKDKEIETLEDNEYNRKWYPEKFGGEVKYLTVSDMEKSGTITKTSSSSTINNNANINFNVETVKETADIDELMDTAMKRVQKYQNTRNTLE